MGPRRYRSYAATGIVLAMAFALNLLPATAARAEVVQVVIEQIYQFRKPSQITYMPIEDFELPVLDLVEDMMFAAGMDVVYADFGEVPDAVITVEVRGRALGSTYLEPVKAFLYTGAQLDGEVKLRRSDGSVAKSSFLSQTQRQFRLSINLGYEDPQNAPFAQTLEMSGGFVESVARVMYETWGVEAIVPSLYENEPTIRASVAKLLGDVGDPSITGDLIEVLEFDDSDRARWEAAWSLGRIGSEQAIPALIDALNDSSEDVRWFSSWSLRTLSGEDYGPDFDTWSNWWADHEGAVEG
jgi:HEAT repeats